VSAQAWLAAAAFFFLGFTCAWLLFRHSGWQDGFEAGERYGRSAGWRDAWMKQQWHKRVGIPPMMHKTQDWYED
jgi:hypothetical protein